MRLLNFYFSQKKKIIKNLEFNYNLKKLKKL